MWDLLLAFLLLLFSYLLGAIPFGLIIVKLATGKDIRQVESGRTGGTNAMRAAGFFAGAATVILDFLKGAVPVWIVRLIFPETIPWAIWIEVFAPVAAVLGHNYSIFLMERNEKGQLRLRGGAGGATSVGGATGLWLPAGFIIIPLALLVLFGIGYASLATLSVGVLTTLIFAYRAWTGDSPWQYVVYGILIIIILAIALRPNFIRLIHGNERVVGWRARRKKLQSSSSSSSSS